MSKAQLSQVEIGPEALSSADVQRLIAELNAELSARYMDPSANHFELDESEVSGDNGVMLVARVDGQARGCVAVRRLDEFSGELKRMYVAPTGRGMGIGAALLDAIADRAQQLGMFRLLLETGPKQPEAVRLYERDGFQQVPPFGKYVHSPMSICMSKDLVSPEAEVLAAD